ncbi:MAG TPA: T9SS type A sorting domain-containing protein, partial [Candidatus Sulfotelmatobacter sp.]|nr:T9SS type A sorting domain-containing protein [Candidatus Sulfotelmatobacter sp.]
GHDLTPGAYVGAHRYPFQASTEPGLDISGNGRGCNQLSGLFIVRQITTDPSNNVTSFWATFEQHCENGIPKLSGEIRINADTSLYVVSPSDFTVQVHTPVHFDISAVDAGGLPTQLSLDSPPAGATFVDHGNGTGTFDWPAGPASAGDFVIVFHARDTAGKTAVGATTIHAFGADLISIASDPGDYIGGGQSHHFTHADGAFTLHALQGRGAEVTFNGSGQSWMFDLLPPYARALQPGIYLNATRYPFQAANDPGLSVTANSGGCNTLTGSFQVRSVTFDSNSDVSSLWATLEQHCEGIAPKLLAEIRINVDTAVYVGSPADAFTPPGVPLAFDVSAHDTRGFGVTLSAAGVPAGAQFVDHGDGTGTLAWHAPGPPAIVVPVTFTAHSAHGEMATSITNIHVLNPTFLNMASDPGDYIGGGATYHFTSANATFSGYGSPGYVNMSVTGGQDWFYLDFSAPYGQVLAPGSYPGTMRFNGTGNPGLDVSGDGRGCNTSTGTFTVKAIGFDPLGNLSTFWSTFTQHCEGGPSALSGEIYYVTDAVVPALASLVRSDASNGEVSLRWLADGRRSQPARVFRRTRETPWEERTTVMADGSGYLDYTDRDVTAGTRYDYRLGWDSNGATAYGPESWVEVPLELPRTLALEPIQPNPVTGPRLTLAFSLPEAQTASVELVDIAGRSALKRELTGLTAGRHVTSLDELSGLPPGFYVVRLQAGQRSVTRRALLVR